MNDANDPGQGQQPPYGEQPPPYLPPPPYGEPQPPMPQPYAPPPYGQLPDEHTIPYGQPVYPGPEYGQPYGPPPSSAPPPPTRSTLRPLLLAGVIVAVLAALVIAGIVLSSAGDESSSAQSRAPIPAISIPPLASLPNNVPRTAPINPCAYMTDPQAVAVAYVGAAEIGQVGVAQSCVFRNSVPRSMTASLAATSGELYAPTGSKGSIFRFASIDGRSHLAVTVTKESDGTYYITDVVKS